MTLKRVYAYSINILKCISDIQYITYTTTFSIIFLGVYAFCRMCESIDVYRLHDLGGKLEDV